MTACERPLENPKPRTLGEHLSCSLMLLRLVPMRSGFQQCFHGDNTGSNPRGDANKIQ